MLELCDTIFCLKYKHLKLFKKDDSQSEELPHWKFEIFERNACNYYTELEKLRSTVKNKDECKSGSPIQGKLSVVIKAYLIPRFYCKVVSNFMFLNERSIQIRNLVHVMRTVAHYLFWQLGRFVQLKKAFILCTVAYKCFY